MQKKSEATNIKLDLKIFLDLLAPSLWTQWHSECNLRALPFYSKRNDRFYVPAALMSNEGLKALLLDIVKNDNWKEHADIDMTKHAVTKIYVNSYFNKAKELPNGLYNNHLQEINLLILYAVATRFYIEKTLLKLPLPSTKVSEKKAHEDYKLLKNTSGNSLSLNNMTGKKAANFFMEEVRFQCPNDHKTYGEYWNTPILIGRLVTWMKHYNYISNATFNRIRNDNVVSAFRPAAVKYLVNYIHEKDSNIKISSYLNLCGGWGCRLVGALSTPEITRYIQTDPNPDLFPITKQIYEAYDPKKKTEVHFYDKPMEDLTREQLCPNGKKNQFVFFSPPFFAKEKYKGAMQSHIRYPKKESWCNDFLYQSLKVSYFALENGILAINLANILIDKGAEFKLTDCLVHLLDNNMANYFTKFSAPLKYPNKKAPPSFIYMYKTKPYKDSLGIYPDFIMQPGWIVKKEDRTNRIESNTTTTTTAITQTIQPHTLAARVLPCTVAKPSINDTTLFNLHRIIERFNTLIDVAKYYDCSALAVIKRISDWDLKLSFEKLKYNYASSSELQSVRFYNKWRIADNILLIDEQQFNTNTIYISFINSNPYNQKGFLTEPGSNSQLLQVICLNPHGTLVNHTISMPQGLKLQINMLLDHLVSQGFIKKWIEIPHYNECKSSKRYGIEHLSLTLEELHEIILSETNPMSLIVRLGKDIEGLEADLFMMNTSLKELQSMNPSEAAIRYGNHYNECISTIIVNQLRQDLQFEEAPIANEPFLEEKEEKEIKEVPVEVVETTRIVRRPPPPASVLNSGLFIPKQRAKTKREPEEEESNNKKPRNGF